MHKQAAAGPRLQHAQTAGNISSCNMLENEATCLAATDLNRWLYIWLQHAQTGGNMSGCNMLEQAATCRAATYMNKPQHVWLQHAGTGCKIMLQDFAAFVTTSLFYGLLDVVLVAMQTKLNIF